MDTKVLILLGIAAAATLGVVVWFFVGLEPDSSKPITTISLNTDTRATSSTTPTILNPPSSFTDSFTKYVDGMGQMTLPDDFRSSWIHLGGFVDPGNLSDGYHDVYTQPGVIEAYRRTGTFPDGAVLIKEVRGLTSGNMTTGHISWATDVAIWFMMVKDEQNRYPNNPLWGEGWGWSLYEEKDPNKNIASNYQSDCLSCHIPAQDNDWIYIQGYPVLHDGQVSSLPPPAQSPTESTQVEPPATGEVHTITINSAGSENFFEPDRLLIQPGDTVKWVNESGAHTVTSFHPDNARPLRIPESATSFDSGVMLETGLTFEFTFTEPGVYDYFCLPHEFFGMVGTIVVGEALDGPGLASAQEDLPDPVKDALSDLNEWAKQQ